MPWSLRAQVSTLLGSGYSTNQMSYDLARLRRNGLIRRLPGSNTYLMTPVSQQITIFYTKVHDRLLPPRRRRRKAARTPRTRHALTIIDRHVENYIAHARLGNAA